MARPRKNPDDPKWQETSQEATQDAIETSPTAREIARETEQPVVNVVVQQPVFQPPMPQAPRQMRIERQGARSEPYVVHYPKVRAGVCDHCGVLDPNVPSQYQYKLCPHYRGQQLICSYCPSEKDPDEVIRGTKLEIMQHPHNPWELIVVCSSFDCERAHQKRFQLATS